MSSVPRLGLTLLAAALIGLPATPGAAPQVPGAARDSRPDFDIRDERPAARLLETSDSRAAGQGQPRDPRARVNRESGSVRLLSRPDLSIPPTSPNASVRALLASNARRFGLEPRDLTALSPVRDYTSRSTGIRHLVFAQVVDGIPVFDSAISVHMLPDGAIARITSNAAPTSSRSGAATISDAQARAEAATHAGTAVDAAGAASLAWLPMDGTLRLAWLVVVTAEEPDVYDILIDAQSGALLLRRNRVRYAQGSGRVLQGPGMASLDPRRPDPTPLGANGDIACPPPVNYAVRSLNAPFRDPASVLASTGLLEGNNTRVFRGNSGQAAQGTFDAGGWLFDFPFNSEGSAETFLFFAMNFAHDFYYDLGFDEAAGNFQVDNFGRGGMGGDPVRAKARALGRNNANYMHTSDGNSPTINMFLWDGIGCWADDVDDDGTTDLDGDYDLDIVLHEYHHGVSLRVNTAFSGTEAGAIGEGGGDFFAYSVNGDTTLAEYSRPGGIRRVNNKGYGDWTCQQGFICGVHANGEIWANVLWDVRERFRRDLVRGSEATGVNESHQLYVDGLKLSPPRPTMLDMRDAMLEADAIRNTAGGSSQNFCRLWESFAGRGMGVSATDTADNGQNRVGPSFDVPAGCQAPPVPPLMSAHATTANASEAGTVAGAVTFRRSVPSSSPVTVNYFLSGTAAAGNDYVDLPGTTTLPAGALEVTVPIVPIDDAVVENNETVVVSLVSGSDYSISTPSFATVTIVSDDVAPDLVVTSVSAPPPAGPGGTFQLTETTRNQGTGAAGTSQTWFYLSKDLLLSTTDPLIGTRNVEELAAGASSTATVPLTLPSPLESGTYFVFAKADGSNAVSETNENNNLRVTSIAVGPDLTVSALAAPLQAGAGTTVLVSDTTTNQGGGTAPASATRFFLSVNLLLDASDTPLDARSVGMLAQGQSSTGSTAVAIPPGTASGSYFLIAQADASGAVNEPNEANNTRVTTLKIGPDLTVTNLTGPSRAAAGSTITITDTTRNVGAGGAGQSMTAFYLSTNLAFDAADVRLEPARPVPALAPNEFSTVTSTVMVPDVSAGSWYLLAVADGGNAIVETTEVNNVRFLGIQIGPDLVFTSVGVPSTGVAGTSITVTDTVRNLGAADAGVSVVRYYLSTNGILDASDTPLNAARSVPVLAPNASNSGSASVPLPSGMSGGFYIIAVADGGQTVPEASEQNNAVPRFIQIAPGS